MHLIKCCSHVEGRRRSRRWITAVQFKLLSQYIEEVETAAEGVPTNAHINVDDVEDNGNDNDNARSMPI